MLLISSSTGRKLRHGRHLNTSNVINKHHITIILLVVYLDLNTSNVINKQQFDYRSYHTSIYLNTSNVINKRRIFDTFLFKF